MITVTGKLNKSAVERQLDNGDSMFIVNIGKQEYNRQTKEKLWANYSAALYAKSTQADYYRNATSQGAIVSVSGSGVIPRIWGDNNDKVGLDIQDGKLVYSASTSSVPANPPSQQMQQAPQQQPQQPQNHDFDDDIPF